MKQRFRQLLVRLNADHGTTIFLTSHDVTDIEQVARRVIVINRGEVIYDDDVAAMRRSLLATKLVEITGGEPLLHLQLVGMVATMHSMNQMKPPT